MGGYHAAMDRLLAMQMSVSVAETGSFFKAARDFATTRPPEARLKARLFNRNSRGASPHAAWSGIKRSRDQDAPARKMHAQAAVSHQGLPDELAMIRAEPKAKQDSHNLACSVLSGSDTTARIRDIDAHQPRG